MYTLLVAFAFLGNPPTPYGRDAGCSIVDHIDENKKLTAMQITLDGLHVERTMLSFHTSDVLKIRMSKNIAAKERQRLSNREHMRRKRAKDKED